MKKRTTTKYISKVTSFGFVFPAILVVALLLLYPVVSSIFYSFTSNNLIKLFSGKIQFAFIQHLIIHMADELHLGLIGRLIHSGTTQ